MESPHGDVKMLENMVLRPCPSLYAASGVFPALHGWTLGPVHREGACAEIGHAVPFPSSPASCRCSAAQSCLTPHNPMDCSTLGSHVLHHLPELAQTHVHWVGDAIQPSHPLSSASPHAFSLSPPGSFPMSQFFASGGQSIGTSASASVLSMNIQHWFPLESTGLISLQLKRLSRDFSNTTVQKHQFFSTTICSDIGAPQNKVSHCFCCFPIYLPWSDGTGCHDLSFLNVEFQANFFTLLFHFDQEAL